MAEWLKERNARMRRPGLQGLLARRDERLLRDIGMSRDEARLKSGSWRDWLPPSPPG